jgi:cation diffusion facilitator family transporter
MTAEPPHKPRPPVTLPPRPPSLVRYAWLSLAAALATMGLKAGAAVLTGSVGLLSDALESVVNMAAAIVALVALRVADRPPDLSHHFGHGKAEYFSAVVEGVMILVAAVAVVASAVQRLLEPRPLEQLGIGLAVSVVAAGVNLAVGLVLLRTGRRYGSITLVADGRHLLTDVWTSAGVVVGVAAVALTGAVWLDPVVAIGVGVNIVVTGLLLLRASTAGLMDAALPKADHDAIEAVLDHYRGDQLQFHALRTRQAGRHRFVSVHVLVPGSWSVQQGHDLLERLETELAAALPGATVFTHLEPLEDPASWSDLEIGYDRWHPRPP